jgi:hypothetical protein
VVGGRLIGSSPNPTVNFERVSLRRIGMAATWVLPSGTQSVILEPPRVLQHSFGC